MRFNPPPNWPPAPAGWAPTPDWTPPAEWPAPPPGWQLWLHEQPDNPWESQYSASRPPLPRQSPAIPWTTILAVLGVAIAYVVARVIGMAFQAGLFSGDIGPITDQTAAYIIVGTALALTSIVANLPALLLLSLNGPRPGGGTLARICVWIAILPAAAMILAFLLPATEDLTGRIQSNAGDFLAGTAVMIAWISTHRASKWALVAAPIGGWLVIYAVRIAFSASTSDSAEQFDLYADGPSAAYGEIVVSTFLGAVTTVLVLVASAWLAYGIDEVCVVTKRTLPDRPESMWTSVGPRRRKAVQLVAGALLIATACPAAASLYSSGQYLYSVCLWAVGMAAATALLVLAARKCAVGDLGQSLVLVVAVGIAVVCLLAQTILTMSEQSSTGSAGTLFSIAYHVGLMAIAAMFITALSDRPWGIIAVPLTLLAPVTRVTDYPDTNPILALFDSTEKIVATTMFLLLAVGVGVLVSRGVEAIVTNPERYGLQPPRAAAAGQGFGPPVTNSFPPPGPQPGPPPPAGQWPSPPQNDPRLTARGPGY